MPEKETKEEKKPEKKAPTFEEIMAAMSKDVKAVANVAEQVKRIKDANLLDLSTETELKKELDRAVRGCFGLPEKQQPAQYVPPAPAPAAPIPGAAYPQQPTY